MPDNRFVEVVEVGPRDGLQNEKRQIATVDKIALIDRVGRAGFRRIETTSFVSPKWVPQMADATDVMAAVPANRGYRTLVLTPNLRGYEGARAAGADQVAVFAAASEGFSRANLNASIAEVLERFAPVMDAAIADDIPVRGYISVVTDCPFDGPTPPQAVARVAAALRNLGCAEIALGETLGRGTPERVDAMLAAVLEEVPADIIAGHFHDTGGMALGNVDVSLDRGIRIFDGAVGGLGGCPYAPGAAGNLATERLAAHLTAQGWTTGLDPAVLDEAASFARTLRSLP